MKKNKIYYKVLTEMHHKLMNKDQPSCPAYETEYKFDEWTFAKNDTRLFVYDKMSEQDVDFEKRLGNRVFECTIGNKNIKGNGLDYSNFLLRDKLEVVREPYYTSIKVLSDWFWNNVRKNLKNKKKYCKGMKKFLFSFKDVVMTDKVKLIKEL